MYTTTEGAELCDYIIRPKVGNIYKFSLVFNETMKLKRLLNLDLYNNNKINIILLSATFSELLMGSLDQTLLIQNEQDRLARSNWLSLFTAFESEDELYRKFSPLKVKESEQLTETISRWFLEN